MWGAPETVSVKEERGREKTTLISKCGVGGEGLGDEIDLPWHDTAN